MNEKDPTREEILDHFFRSLPKEVMQVAVFEDENGNYFGYGHIVPAVMKDAILQLDTLNQGKDSELEIDEDEIQYGYAKITEVYEDEFNGLEQHFETVGEDDPEGFPITAWGL